MVSKWHNFSLVRLRLLKFSQLYFYRSILIFSVLAASSVCKFRNSPIHYIKLNSFGHGGLDVQSFRTLAKLFMQPKAKIRERDKSYKGRKISSFNVKDINSRNKPDKVNFIKLGETKNSGYQQKSKIFMDEIKDNEIFRPRLNFTSNAKPELMKYRDVKIEKKKILKKPTKELNRLNKKYKGKVPFHFGYSRKFSQDYPTGKSFQKSSGSSSSLTWLSKPKLSNGLPTSILHMKYPVKITRLSSGKDIRSEYFKNFI